MRVAIIARSSVERIPPLISVIKILHALEIDISVYVTSITEANLKDFNDQGIQVYIIPYNISKSIIKRIWNVHSYRSALKAALKADDFDLIWIEGAGTFRTVLGIVEQYPFVMQISELYDYPEAAPVRKAIAKLIHKAKVVVMPEINRATLYQVQYGLSRRPSILPNKPYFYLEGDEMKICEEKYAEQLKVFDEKKVILYQGIIARERDLSSYIKAVKELGPEYQFVLLGADYGMVDEYRKIDPNIIHISFIPAPEYLVFTSKAYIGMITYDPSTLNCAYCAPNKLYEYGRYGLPMLGNDIPGLRNTIGNYGAGVIVDESSTESIHNGIKEISENYKLFSANAKRLYTDTDNVQSVNEIIRLVSTK